MIANDLGMGRLIGREDDEQEDECSDREKEWDTVEREIVDQEVNNILFYPFNIINC